MDLAIVGFRAGGKTTVFNALTAGHGSAAGGAEQIGAVKIPDDRLEQLAAREKAPLERCRDVINGSARLRERIRDKEDLKALANFGLLSLKPQLILLNIGESEVERASDLEAEFSGRYASAGTAVSVVCAGLE